MNGEVRTEKSPNEILTDYLPEIGRELDNLWKCFANRYIGFAGGGNLQGEPQPEELGLAWSRKVNKLLNGCEAQVVVNDEAEALEWGEMIVLLSDLADELVFYFGPFWGEVTSEERIRTEIRMDVGAQRLLMIFRKRHQKNGGRV